MARPPRHDPEELHRRLQAWVDEWRAHRRSTTPADRPTAEAAIATMYEAGGLSRPTITWAPSVRAAAAVHYEHLEPVRSRYGGMHEIEDPWVRSSRAPTLAGPGNVPSAWIRRGVELLLEAFPDVPRPVSWRDRPATRLVEVAAWAGLTDGLGPHVDREVTLGVARLRAGPRTRATERCVRDGQFDDMTPALAMVAGVLGRTVRRDPSQEQRYRAFLDARLAVARSAGPWWALPGHVTIAERPLVLRVDTAGRLHADEGPALAYADGSTVHAWHGVRVPAHVIDDPDWITIADIDEEPNAEVRRAMLERFGVERFVREGDALLVHEDETGRLWRREIDRRPPGASRSWPPREHPIVMVEVVNATPEPDGSRKTYFLRVPPTMTTAREAVAWTFGLGAVEYRPEVES